MKEFKAFAEYLLNQLLNALKWSVKKIIRGFLWVDRFVIKRYIGLETPIYKMWWKQHAIVMQRKLDKQHKMVKEGKVC